MGLLGNFKNAKTEKKAKGGTRSKGLLGGIKKEKGEFSLKWVGKERPHKDRWEEEKKFKERFINGELKVSRCINLAGGSEYYEYNSDLEYNPR